MNFEKKEMPYCHYFPFCICIQQKNPPPSLVMGLMILKLKYLKCTINNSENIRECLESSHKRDFSLMIYRSPCWLG